jgi:uncharacterized protein (TIGR00290 family)
MKIIKEKILLSWSSGKDSALALYEIKNNTKYEISSLLTTLTIDYNRISMHGVRNELLERQACALGLSLEKIFIPKNISNDEYDLVIKKTLNKFRRMGISSVAFGDVHLIDIRKCREKNLEKIGMKGIFPLWKRNSLDLANRFIELGFKSIITCVDSKTFDPNFLGRDFDEKFLSEIPSSVDPIGENGEFHSFVYEGPIFKEKISFKVGKIVIKNKRFYYIDLLP